MSPSKKCVENELKSENEAKDKQVSSTITNKIRDEIQRKIHNGVEKRRKDKINTWIDKIGELLPHKDPKRDSKNGILERTFHYIIHLKETNDKLMLGHVNEVQENELQECRNRVKQLEITNSSYYKLLRTAGISACIEPTDLWKQRPTKYSNKLSGDQITSLVKKHTDDNDDSSSSESVKSYKSKPTSEVTSKNEETISTSTNNVVALSDSATSASFPVVNSSNNKVRSTSQIQIRPTSNVQLLQNGVTCDSGLSSNLLSGQIIIGHTVINPQTQPQTTAILLPNGQIVPVVSQSQPSLLFAPGAGLVLTSPQVNQLTSLQTNVNTNSAKPTTTVEIVPASPESSSSSKNKKEYSLAKKPKKKAAKAKNDSKKPVKSKKCISKSDSKCDETSDESTKNADCGVKNGNQEVTATESVMTESDILAKATESIFSPRSSNKNEETACNTNNEKQENKRIVSETNALQKDKFEKNEARRNDELSNNEEPPPKRCKTTESMTSSEKLTANSVQNNEANNKTENLTKNAMDNNSRLLTTENNSEIFSENHRNEENLGGDQDSELPSILGLTEDNVISPESVNSVSNSNLSAFLSLSPDFLSKDSSSSNQISTNQSLMSVSNLVPPVTSTINTTSTITALQPQHPYIPSLNNFNASLNSESNANFSAGVINLNKDFLSQSTFIEKTVQKHPVTNPVENCVSGASVHNRSVSDNLIHVSHQLSHQQQTSSLQSTHHHHSPVSQQQQHLQPQRQQLPQTQSQIQTSASQHQAAPPQHQPQTSHQSQQQQHQQSQGHHHQQIQQASNATFNSHQQQPQQSQTNEQRKMHPVQLNFQPQIHHQKTSQQTKQTNSLPYLANHHSTQQMQQQMQQQAPHSSNSHQSTTSSSYSAEALLREQPTNTANYSHNNLLPLPIEQNNNYLSNNVNTNNPNNRPPTYSSLPYSSVFSYSAESLLRQQPPTTTFNYTQNLLPLPTDQTANYSHQHNSVNSNRPPISYSAESLLAANHGDRREANKAVMRAEDQQDTYRRQYSQNFGQSLSAEQVVTSAQNQQQSKHNRDQNHHQSHRTPSLQSQNSEQRKMHSMQTNFPQIQHQKSGQPNKQANSVTYPSTHHSSQQIQQMQQQSHPVNNHQSSSASSYSAEALLREQPTHNNYSHHNILPLNVEQNNYSLPQNNSSNNTANRPPISYSLPYSMSAYSTESLLRQQPSTSTFNYGQNWLPLPIEQSSNYSQHNPSNANRPPISYSAESILGSVSGSGSHAERRDNNKTGMRTDDQETYRRHYSQNCGQGVNVEHVVANAHNQQQSKHSRDQSQSHQQTHRTQSLQSQNSEQRKLHSMQSTFQPQMHHQKAPQKQANAVPYLSSHHQSQLQQPIQQSSHSSNNHQSTSSSYSAEALLREQPLTNTHNYSHNHNLLPLNVEQFIGLSAPNSKSSAKRKTHF